MKSITYYTAPWCAPCARLKPMAKRIAAEVGADFAEVDVDVAGAAVPHDIKGVPTVIIRDGMVTTAILSPDMVGPSALRKALA